MEQIWQFVNSPVGITTIAGIILWALNKLYSKKPAWQKFEGTIISAIKFAEKAIPDKSENKGMHRLDEALQYAVRVYEETTKKRASDAVKAELKEGIQIVHDKLESSGTIK